MARSYGQIKTGIWRDESWRTLTLGAQWLYELLLSQPQLSLVGVIAYTPTRWATYATDAVADDIDGWADELAAARYVVLDRDLDEICVRSLLRHDGALKQARLIGPLYAAMEAVQSQAIRDALGVEMGKVTEDAVATSMWKGFTDLRDAYLSTPGNPLPNPFANPLPNPLGDPTPDPSCARAGASTATATVTTTDPQQVGGLTRAPAKRPRKPETPPPDELPVTDAMREWAAKEGLASVDLTRETAQFLDYHRAKDSRQRDWLATWRTWMRRVDGYTPAPNGRGAASYDPHADLNEEWDAERRERKR